MTSHIHSCCTQDELSRESSRKDQELLSLTQQVESHVQKIDSLHEELNEANSQLSGLSNSFMVSSTLHCQFVISVNKEWSYMDYQTTLVKIISTGSHLLRCDRKFKWLYVLASVKAARSAH